MTHTTVSHGVDKQVAKQSYLTRRGAVYWFRRRVPGDLVPVLKKSFWFDSLGTKDPREAAKLARARAAQTDHEIEAASKRLRGIVAPALKHAEAQALAKQELARWLTEDAEARLSWGRKANENAEVVIEAFESEAREALANGDWRPKAQQAHDVLCRAGRWYPEDDPSIRMMAGALLAAEVEWIEALKQRQAGKVVEVVAPPVHLRAAAPSVVHGRTLGDLIDAYRKNRIARRDEESTSRKYDHIFKALEAAIGRDRVVATITKQDCRDVKDLLQRIPAHMGKKYPGLGITEAIAAGERDGAAKLAPNTVVTYLHNLSAVFQWALDEDDGWLVKNPAKGLAEKGRPSVQRRGFTPEELLKLFTPLVAERVKKPWRFWVPALAAYSGARANELCQLRVADIVDVDGRVCIDLSVFDEDGVRVTDKRLKTAASARLIPLHPEIIAAGFADFVAAARRTGRDRLFPDLKEGPDGGYSHDLSKWFARHLDNVGLTAPSLVFHSFRHGFKDACRLAGIDSETSDALGGWAARGQSAKYGKRGMVPVLYRELVKVKFGAFRLPHAAGSGR
ncbi:integrase [Caulobacter rhizosphaerae]|nr:integrase [Caulobacter rhizosphaerae]